MRIKTLYLAYSLEQGQTGKPLDSGRLLGNHRTWTGAGRRLATIIHNRKGDKPSGSGWYFAVNVDTGEIRARNQCKGQEL